jgi:putative addiction module component (TIGR02574 family)
MPRSAAELLSDALELSDEERIDLALELLGSVAPEVPGSSRPDDEWIAEIERRVAASNGSSGRPWQEVRAEIESKLARK